MMVLLLHLQLISLVTELLSLTVNVTIFFYIKLRMVFLDSSINIDEKNYLFLGKRRSPCARLFGSTLMHHFTGYLNDDSTLDFVHATEQIALSSFSPLPLASDLTGYMPKRMSSLSVFSFLKDGI